MGPYKQLLQFLLTCTRKTRNFLGSIVTFESYLHKLLINRWVKLFNMFIPLLCCLSLSNWIKWKTCKFLSFQCQLLEFGLDKQDFLFYINELLQNQFDYYEQLCWLSDSPLAVDNIPQTIVSFTCSLQPKDPKYEVKESK